MVIASKTGREDLGKCPATTSPARWWLTSTDPRSLSIAIEYSSAETKWSNRREGETIGIESVLRYCYWNCLEIELDEWLSQFLTCPWVMITLEYHTEGLLCSGMFGLSWVIRKTVVVPCCWVDVDTIPLSLDLSDPFDIIWPMMTNQKIEASQRNVNNGIIHLWDCAPWPEHVRLVDGTRVRGVFPRGWLMEIHGTLTRTDGWLVVE